MEDFQIVNFDDVGHKQTPLKSGAVRASLVHHSRTDKSMERGNMLLFSAHQVGDTDQQPYANRRLQYRPL